MGQCAGDKGQFIGALDGLWGGRGHGEGYASGKWESDVDGLKHCHLQPEEYDRKQPSVDKVAMVGVFLCDECGDDERCAQAKHLRHRRDQH